MKSTLTFLFVLVALAILFGLNAIDAIMDIRTMRRIEERRAARSGPRIVVTIPLHRF